MNKKYLIYSVIIAFYASQADAITFDARKFFNPKAALHYAAQAEFPLTSYRFLDNSDRQHDFALNNMWLCAIPYLLQECPKINRIPHLHLISIAIQTKMFAVTNNPDFPLNKKLIEPAIRIVQKIPFANYLLTTAYDRDDDEVIKSGKYSIRKNHMRFLLESLIENCVDTNKANLFKIESKERSYSSFDTLELLSSIVMKSDTQTTYTAPRARIENYTTVTSSKKLLGFSTEPIAHNIAKCLHKLFGNDWAARKTEKDDMINYEFSSSDRAKRTLNCLSGPWGKYYQTPAIVGIKLLLDAISTKPTAKTTEKNTA